MRTLSNAVIYMNPSQKVKQTFLSLSLRPWRSCSV